MDFERLRLAHMGQNTDDGVGLVQEVEERLQDLASMIVDDRYTAQAKLTVEIELKREGDGAVVIASKVKEGRPRRRRRAVTAFVNESGELMTQRGEQMPLPLRRPRAVAGESKKED